MFRNSHDDELDSWVARAASAMICVAGGLSLLLFSALAISAMN